MTNSSKLTNSSQTYSVEQATCGSHAGPHLHDVHAFSEQQIEQRLLAAEKLCAEKGARFTPLRKMVYQLILQSDKPLGAYDLIQGLQDSRTKQDGEKAKMVAPPTVYRTLEFLLEFGFIHQLTSINAFVPCCHPRDQHNAVFLLCNACQRVQEFSGMPVQQIVNYVKQQVGFQVQQCVMELKGLCDSCLPHTSALSSAEA
ncbi:Fur family transcriptional regulator [Psychrobacter sp. FDAARGOS_221]|uniref:Fur family transcriptional regulator n=1 Tax=Psychrobacter sp. FDAARGOS_221 TaxID=1975705 RepID=UPI000BB59B52|nr:transcriptional repressor [Psychrobacter sp. FDAARGOS_221]PNK60551.1 Fur family transcriptional regulator [Psychrobacter sp. FDAARGOS_221]